MASTCCEVVDSFFSNIISINGAICQVDSSGSLYIRDSAFYQCESELGGAITQIGGTWKSIPAASGNARRSRLALRSICMQILPTLVG
jgi:hypothetical protein